MTQKIVSITILILMTVGCKNDISEPSAANPRANTDSAIIAGAMPSEMEKSSLLAAKDELFKKLSGKLMSVMSEKGPVAAIEVCQVEAKSLALEVGEAANVKIGRTGVRLRNTDNVPPIWAQKLVNDRTESPVFAKLSNDHAAALLPIKLQVQCLMCHGPSEALAPEVKEKLSSLYPQDRATGFSEGELRGWFWVELLD